MYSRQVSRLRHFSEQNKKPERTTKAEAKLWSYLNQWKTGYRCIREYVVKPYIADFAFPDIKMIVEADGRYHEGRIEYDNRRDAFLSGIGWTVMRFQNHHVENDIQMVIDSIIANADCLADHYGVSCKYKKGKSPCGRIY